MGHYPQTVLEYSAAPGERNEVAVAVEGVTVRIREAALPITAGEGCRQAGEREVVCDYPSGVQRRASFALGDAADSLVTSGNLPGVVLDGGAGDDAVAGGDADEALAGGTGSDRLSGGGGSDTVTYFDSAAPVTVDLAQGRGGVAGENDVLLGIENAIGGPAEDVLNGDDTANGLNGGPGRVTLVGRGGADGLHGGERLDTFEEPVGSTIADDQLDGGAGDDSLNDRAGQNRLSGGDGNDQLSSGSGSDHQLGGTGDDSLVDSAGANRLDAGDGDDRVEGGPENDVARAGAGRDFVNGGSGRDRLVPGPGVDRVLGGSGRDGIRVRDRTRDRVSCGGGRDSVLADRIDRLFRCERIRRR